MTKEEVEHLVGSLGFRVMVGQDGNRAGLNLNRAIAARQTRLGCRPVLDLSQVPNFADALNRWLPPNVARLLWISYWGCWFPHTAETFLAARRGLGEARSFLEVPGHYFDAHPFDEWDQAAVSPEHESEVSILVGLVTMIMTNQWDGWLIAVDGTDRIEFWEGNVFFYSEAEIQLAAAGRTMDQFKLSRKAL